MQYDTLEGIQGICPDGWHLPTHDEWLELERFIGIPEDEIDLYNTWRGTNEGTQLQPGGTFGFEALMAGIRTGDPRVEGGN